MKRTAAIATTTTTTAIVAALLASSLLGYHVHRIATSLHGLPLALDDLSVELSYTERAHILDDFLGCHEATNSSSKKAQDTVWAKRAYAPMFIHRGALREYKEAIEQALPGFVVAFDVVFEAAETEVPWHCDYDSLGPFANIDMRSIARTDFVTVHANLRSPTAGGGQLRTLNSLPVASAHYAFNVMSSSFGGLASLTAPIADLLGAKTHSGAEGKGNFFNNMATHSVTAGAGRISYVVRLVRQDVPMRRSQVEAAASGALGTRRLTEFGRFLPHMESSDEIRAGDFPWQSVASMGSCSQHSV